MTACWGGTPSPGVFTVMITVTQPGTTTLKQPSLCALLARPESQCTWTSLRARCPSTEWIHRTTPWNTSTPSPAPSPRTSWLGLGCGVMVPQPGCVLCEEHGAAVLHRVSLLGLSQGPDNTTLRTGEQFNSLLSACYMLDLEMHSQSADSTSLL